MKILFVQKVKALVGSEKYFLDLIPELEKKGIQTEFICVYNQADEEKTLPFIQQYQQKGLVIHVLKVPSDKAILKTLTFIKKIEKNGNFNLIHSHLIHADFWCALLRKFKQIKTPVVSTKHGYDEAYIAQFGFDGSQVPNNLYYRLCRFSEKYIQQSFAVSNGLKHLFIESGICLEKNIRTIHHGFQLPAVERENQPNQYRFSPFQMVILGRIIPFKGHMKAMQALASVKEELGDFKCLIIGHGDEGLIRDLKAYVDENQMQNQVDFLGYQSNIYDYLTHSDLMLVPSIAEGFGLVFLEAMNSHLPIIGFDVPATNEIVVNQKSGYLIPPYQTDVMGQKILDIKANLDLRKQMGDFGFQRLNKYFSLDRMVNETIQFYKDNIHL